MASQSTLSYIKIDFQSHKDALLARIKARWPRAWNDFLSNSFGIVIVDIVAYTLATMAFLVNRVAGENYIGTMTLRESAVRIGALGGYQLHNPIPATVYCEATLPSVLDSDVVISAGTAIRSADGVAFEVAQDYTVLAGSLTPVTEVAVFSATQTGALVVNSFVTVTSGATTTSVVDSTIDVSQIVQVGQSFRVVGDSTVYTIESLGTDPSAVSPYTQMILDRPYEGLSGSAEVEVFDQRIRLVQGVTVVDRFVAPSTELETLGFSVKLTRAPVIDNAVQVTVNGELWTKVSASTLRFPTDAVYVVKTFADGTSAVVFGNNSIGQAVPTDAAIVVTYSTGGGVAGNIPVNRINTSITGLLASTSGPVSVAITNATSSGTGGQDAESLEQARANIPAYFRSNNRCVTLEDYQTFAMAFTDPTFGSVAFARASVPTQNGLLEGNVVNVYAWTTGPEGALVNLSAGLRQALVDYLQSRAVATDFVTVYDGTSRPVPLALRFKAFAGYDLTTVRNNVVDTVDSMINALRPGSTLVYSNLVRTIDEVEGVDAVNFATPISDLTPSSDVELLTIPDDAFVYDVTKVGAGADVEAVTGDAITKYAAQLPVYPLAAWAFRLFLGTTELYILPYSRVGYARVVGGPLSTDDITDTDSDGIPDHHSLVNLLTGVATLWVKGIPGDLTMKLVSVQGYTADRAVNVYIGYTGDNSVTKRREIRSILQGWSAQLGIGQPMYARPVSGIQASNSSITAVVASVTGVDAVSRVALDTPTNTDDRVLASSYELLRVGNIVINNLVD